eukprot:jgi/Bigna1/84820/estExt_fgenesh1_pg.C_10135
MFCPHIRDLARDGLQLLMSSVQNVDHLPSKGGARYERFNYMFCDNSSGNMRFMNYDRHLEKLFIESEIFWQLRSLVLSSLSFPENPEAFSWAPPAFQEKKQSWKKTCVPHFRCFRPMSSSADKGDRYSTLGSSFPNRKWDRRQCAFDNHRGSFFPRRTNKRKRKRRKKKNSPKAPSTRPDTQMGIFSANIKPTALERSQSTPETSVNRRNNRRRTNLSIERHRRHSRDNNNNNDIQANRTKRRHRWDENLHHSHHQFNHQNRDRRDANGDQDTSRGVNNDQNLNAYAPHPHPQRSVEKQMMMLPKEPNSLSHTTPYRSDASSKRLRPSPRIGPRNSNRPLPSMPPLSSSTSSSSHTSVNTNTQTNRLHRPVLSRSISTPQMRRTSGFYSQHLHQQGTGAGRGRKERRGRERGFRDQKIAFISSTNASHLTEQDEKGEITTDRKTQKDETESKAPDGNQHSASMATTITKKGAQAFMTGTSRVNTHHQQQDYQRQTNSQSSSFNSHRPSQGCIILATQAPPTNPPMLEALEALEKEEEEEKKEIKKKKDEEEEEEDDDEDEVDTSATESSSYSSTNSATAFPAATVKKEKSDDYQDPSPFPSHLVPSSSNFLNGNGESIGEKEKAEWHDSHHHQRLADDSNGFDGDQEDDKDVDDDDGGEGERKAYSGHCQQQQQQQQQQHRNSSCVTRSIFSSDTTGRKKGNIFMLLNGIEIVYQRMEERFMQLHRRFSSVEVKLKNMDRRLERIESTTSSSSSQTIHRQRGGEGGYKG